MKNKKVAVMLACALTVGCAIGGSLAWLTDQTGNVTNTFTVGDINIDLKEHDYVPSDKTLNKEEIVSVNTDYVFVPGDTLPKDPFVTVKADSEDCYLFVKVSGINNTHEDLSGRIINWTVLPRLVNTTKQDVEWKCYAEITQYEAVNSTVVSTEYWYRKVQKSQEDQIWYILQNDNITVNPLVTKDMVSDINKENEKPQVVLTAAAVQANNLTDSTDENDRVAAAWGQLSESFRKCEEN